MPREIFAGCVGPGGRRWAASIHSERRGKIAALDFSADVVDHAIAQRVGSLASSLAMACKKRSRIARVQWTSGVEYNFKFGVGQTEHHKSADQCRDINLARR